MRLSYLLAIVLALIIACSGTTRTDACAEATEALQALDADPTTETVDANVDNAEAVDAAWNAALEACSNTTTTGTTTNPDVP